MLDPKEKIARGLAYVWILFILIYILKRLNASLTHSTLLPSIPSVMVYNIGMTMCWFGILSMPSILLLVITKPFYDTGSRIMKSLFYVAFIITAIVFIVMYSLK